MTTPTYDIPRSKDGLTFSEWKAAVLFANGGRRPGYAGGGRISIYRLVLAWQRGFDPADVGTGRLTQEDVQDRLAAEIRDHGPGLWRLNASADIGKP